MSGFSFSKGYNQYGASMGRSASRPGTLENVKLQMRAVHLDTGGYDSGGAYWGCGETLYCVRDYEGDYEFFFRASSRKEAESQLSSDFPNAKFRRIAK